MTDRGVDTDAIVDRANDIVLGQPGTLILAYLLITAGFAGGMTLITTEPDLEEAFIEDVPEYEAWEIINEEFGNPFAPPTQSTQLIHLSNNVLAQEELIRNLRVIERAERHDELRIEDATGPAVMIARHLDQTANTPTAQRRTLERASDREIRAAATALGDNPAFRAMLSDDFNARTGTASTSITVIIHDFPPGLTTTEFQSVQQDIRQIADDEPSDIRTFGEGIINQEFTAIIGDSLAIVIPVALLVILAVLLLAYRDPIDMILGLIALFMSIIWTFGFVGIAGIPFDQVMIAVPVLLLAVGIDFGIHLINRYREEVITGIPPVTAMRTATRQLAVAFFIVTVTTAIGFGANIISDLGPIQNFGLVSGIGIVFTFLIFSTFLPAAKLATDQYRNRHNLPVFATSPIATEDSPLGRTLAAGATATRHAPLLFVLLFLIIGIAAAGYGQDIDQTFETEDFLPPEELPAYITGLPDPFAPGDYTVTQTITLLQDRFETSQEETVILFVEGPFELDHALESIHRTNADPPGTFTTTDRRADTQSIITVIHAHADQDPEFAALVQRNDRTETGIPDRNLDLIYAELFSSPTREQASSYLTSDRRGAKIEYTVDADATNEEITADARAFAAEFRYQATPTGNIVIFQAVADMIFTSAIASLALAIILTGAFLIIIYGVLDGRPLLGLVNLFPILITVAILVATMRAIGMPLNALTATILAITIGVGVAYSVHLTHRFTDEYTANEPALPALVRTLSGTGGALTGSMLTTALGMGALILAITPLLGDFGLLMAISVFYAYATAIIVLPPTLLFWAQTSPRLHALIPRVTER